MERQGSAEGAGPRAPGILARLGGSGARLRVVVDARLVTYQRAGIGNYLLSLLAGLREILGREQILVLTSRQDHEVGEALPDLPRRALWTPPHHRLEQVALPVELTRVGGDV